MALEPLLKKTGAIFNLCCFLECMKHFCDYARFWTSNHMIKWSTYCINWSNVDLIEKTGYGLALYIKILLSTEKSLVVIACTVVEVSNNLNKIKFLTIFIVCIMNQGFKGLLFVTIWSSIEDCYCKDYLGKAKNIYF